MGEQPAEAVITLRRSVGTSTATATSAGTSGVVTSTLVATPVSASNRPAKFRT